MPALFTRSGQSRCVVRVAYHICKAIVRPEVGSAMTQAGHMYVPEVFNVQLTVCDSEHRGLRQSSIGCSINTAHRIFQYACLLLLYGAHAGTINSCEEKHCHIDKTSKLNLVLASTTWYKYVETV